MTFMLYHSGFDMALTEGPTIRRRTGVDALVKSLANNGIEPNARTSTRRWARRGAS